MGSFPESFEARADHPAYQVPFESGKITPWHTWVVLLRIDSGQGSSQCSGILLTPQLVLTAGHCVDSPQARISVEITTNYRLDPLFRVTTDKMHAHVALKSKNPVTQISHDIGVVILPKTQLPESLKQLRALTPFSLEWSTAVWKHRRNHFKKWPISAVKWNSIEELKSSILETYHWFRQISFPYPKEIWAGGYGLQHYDHQLNEGHGNGNLNFVKMPQTRFSLFLNIWAQVGPSYGKVLPGDSGGPLFFPWKRTWQIAGIVSSGFFTPFATDPVVQAFAAMPENLRWLKVVAKSYGIDLTSHYPELAEVN